MIIARTFVAGMRTSAGRSRTLRKHHERVGEVRRQVEERLDPLHRRERGVQARAQELARRLHGALGPTELLRAEGADVLRQLGRRHHVLAVDEAPAGELGAVARGRGLRSACRAASRRSSRSPACATCRRCREKLKSQPAAERARFSTRWCPSSISACVRVSMRVLAVQVAPARLHHPHLRGRCMKWGTTARRKSGCGRKSASKMATSSPLATFSPCVERARLVADAVDAMDVGDVEAALAQLSRRWRRDDGARLVGRVVEHLDLQARRRPLDRGHLIEQTVDDRGLVVERQLHRDERERLERRRPTAARGHLAPWRAGRAR